MFVGESDFGRSYFWFFAVPILNLLGIFFAAKGVKSKESSWASISLLIIGILTFVVVLLNYFPAIMFMVVCNTGPC